jgi:predicted nucleotidyltransferase
MRIVAILFIFHERRRPQTVGAALVGEKSVPMPMREEHRKLTETAKRAAGVLKEAGVPFLLAGGLASWARGGPQTDHDVDLFVKPDDADAALQALEQAGLKTEKPPERWLYKAYDDDGTLIDLIFRPSGGPVTDEYFDHAEEVEVMGVDMAVASLADVMTTKLLALSEQEPDFTSVLEISRMLREQINWDYVRERTQDSPFAKAFFTLAEELGIVERAPA